MISLSDRQLATVMDSARNLSPEKRSTFLQRIAAQLRRFDNRFIPDAAVAEAAATALRGLVHESVA